MLLEMLMPLFKLMLLPFIGVSKNQVNLILIIAQMIAKQLVNLSHAIKNSTQLGTPIHLQWLENHLKLKKDYTLDGMQLNTENYLVMHEKLIIIFKRLTNDLI